MSANETTPQQIKDYESLLRVRGDVALTTLRAMRDRLSALIAEMEKFDALWEVAETDPTKNIIKALRAQYPELESVSDLEIAAKYRLPVHKKE